jgi:hypothetical protein
MWIFDEIETPLDPLKSQIQTIDAPLDTRQISFKSGHSNFKVAHVIRQTIHFSSIRRK